MNDRLDLAVRAWTTRDDAPAVLQRHPSRKHQLRAALVVDTETIIDPSQALTFGAFRYYRIDPSGLWHCAQEGLFHADNLATSDPGGYEILRDHAATHQPDVDPMLPDHSAYLGLLSRQDFVERVFWKAAYKARATVIMFNAPFDLARLAIHVGEGRNRFHGGFSLQVFANDRYRPRIGVKSIDSKRALKGFTSADDIDAEDRDEDHAFRGHFLDLRTLAFALTGKSYSLAGASAAFGLEHGKTAAEQHGIITPNYIDYCRRDVQATAELAMELIREYDRHPIDLQVTRAYSPASIAKGYLTSIGIRPPLLTNSHLSPADLGASMVSFYGGRAECRIRNLPVPVVVCDFTSMYPTVNALMGLWPLITANRIDAIDATEQVQQFLNQVSLVDCYQPATWPQFVGVAQIIPDGDILPVRATYGPEPGWTIGVNPLNCKTPLWFTIPDLVTSKLLTGKTPIVLRAIRYQVAAGGHQQLHPVSLRGQVLVDPNQDDFYVAIVTRRAQLKTETADHPKTCRCEPCRTAAFLKVLVNAGSYGIFAELNRIERPASVNVHGIAADSWRRKVDAPERPGDFCFPPLAACITGAARLMLTLLEIGITDLGGTWAFADTDAMAIVANETGVFLRCPGGSQLLPDGTPAIRALTFDQVEELRHRFDALNPYGLDQVPDLLKKETRAWCLAISAKRYALFHFDADGQPVIDHIEDEALPGQALKREPVTITVGKNSQHGLGHLLNPSDPDSEDRDWIATIWMMIIRGTLGLSVEEPNWLDRPALSRVTVSSPQLLRPFSAWNEGRNYQQRVKPFNFLLTGHVAPFGHPPAVDPTSFCLVAPFEVDANKWGDLDWRNRYDPDGPRYRITGTPWDATLGHLPRSPAPIRQTPRVQVPWTKRRTLRTRLGRPPTTSPRGGREHPPHRKGNQPPRRSTGRAYREPAGSRQRLRPGRQHLA
jgi:hypothetical protein